MAFRRLDAAARALVAVAPSPLSEEAGAALERAYRSALSEGSAEIHVRHLLAAGWPEES